MNGKIIVIEGASDGIGKTTQYELLKQKLINDGNNIVTHHFPSYGKEQGKLVELYLEGKFGERKDLNPYFIGNLYAVDRAITWNNELKKEYENGKTILLDRYTTSNLIYQSVFFDNVEDKKEFIDFIEDFEYNKLGIKRPDKVIFLYVPFDLVQKMHKSRKENEGIINDIHERDLELMKKVHENSLFVAKYLNFEIINCSNNGELRTKEDISEEIYTKVKK